MRGLKIPASEEMERAVLAAILLDPGLVKAHGERLDPDLFSVRRHQALWIAIAAITEDGEPLDVRSIQDRLEHHGTWTESGGIAELARLELDLPALGHFESYLVHLEEYRTRRQLIAQAGAIAQMAARNGQPVAAMVARAQRLIGEVGRDSRPGGYRPIRAILTESVRPMLGEGERPLLGLSTGFYGLDDLLGGLRVGGLYVLAGRPSMGKSSLAGAVALAVARQGASVGIVALEETEAEWGVRLLSIASGVARRRMQHGECTLFERQFVETTLGELDKLPIDIDDSGEPTAAVILGRARRLKPRVLFVDHLGYVGGDRDRVREVGAITKGLKRFAKPRDGEEGSSVVLLCQLSRKCEERTDKRPILPDLRESGDVEQDADAVMFIYRDEYYNRGGENAGKAEAIVRKHRGGRTGTAQLLWQAETTTFYEAKGA